MASVTHLDRVRAGIRTAWPTGIVCPPLVVRWRAGSERAGWATLAQLATVRAEHRGNPIIEALTRAVSVELVARSDAVEMMETAKHLIAGTLGVLSGADSADLGAVDAYLSGAA
ncbi:MAG TPA: hypothetical protein VLV81_01335 [Acidimicrobiia bacterium]|nr:hypothetical protein [Acidimicrobiia bacterium]